MNSRLKTVLKHICTALLLLLSGAPTLLLVSLNQRDLDHHDLLVIVAGSALGLVFIFALTRIAPRIGLLVLSLIALISVPQSWFVYNFGWTLDPNALSLIAETNIAEAMDLLGSITLGVWLLAVSPPVLAILCLLVSEKVPTHRTSRDARLAGLSAAGAAAIFAGVTWVGAGGSPNVPDATFPAAPRGQALAIRAAYPASLALLFSDYMRDRSSLESAIERSLTFRFEASAISRQQQRRVFVLVIGETVRADHLQLNGYERQTTPRLSKTPDVISLSRMYSRSTFTRLSVPVILSRKPPESVAATFQEASIVRAFREAGYVTSWISLQAPIGYHESPTSVHAKEAHQTVFLNPADYRSNGKRDDAALPALQTQLAQTMGQDVFIVIHMLGSHFRYSDRYPARFSRFLPDRRENQQLKLFSETDKDYLVNSYDNSILFTDYVLSSMIQLLGSLPEAESWLMYVSDHGEALFDDCRKLSGHGQSAKATQSVAAIFWPSPVFKARNHALVANIKENRNQLTSTAMMFETLVSLGGFHVPNPRPQNDLTQLALRIPTEVQDVERLDAEACSGTDQPFSIMSTDGRADFGGSK